MIEIRKLRKIFRNASEGELEVLREVSFSAEKGAITSVVGVNGCGKTTILKIIAGVVEPTNGHIFIDGVNIKNTSNKVKIGYIPQKLALFPWLTAYRNVVFPLELSSSHMTDVGQRRETAERMLRMVDLGDFRDYFIAQLSGGMQQKLAIARGLVTNPDLLLMDEPFGSLDVISRSYLNSELLRIWKELRPTIILVTHDPREAIKLSKRVIVLSSRPATVRDVIEVPFSYPRKEDSEFTVLVDRVWAGLENKKT